MRTLLKTLLVLALFAALPLRGYAGVMVAHCDAHQGGDQAAHQSVHEHGSEHGHGSQDGEADQSAFASVCSLCAACSVAAPLVSDSPRPVAFAPQGASRIPFLERHAPGFSPDHPDRPPLVLSR